MKSRTLPGINIQHPWTEFLLSGKKTIETRTYPIPKKYIGVEMAIIETPAKSKVIMKDSPSVARIVGTIIFGTPIKYENARSWRSDSSKHLVTEKDMQFSWKQREGDVWGWPVIKVTRLSTPLPKPSTRGIVFAKNCKI